MVGSLQKAHTRFPKQWGLALVMTENTSAWCPPWWTAYHSWPLWSRWHYLRIHVILYQFCQTIIPFVCPLRLAFTLNSTLHKHSLSSSVTVLMGLAYCCVTASLSKHRERVSTYAQTPSNEEVSANENTKEDFIYNYHTSKLQFVFFFLNLNDAIRKGVVQGFLDVLSLLFW